MIQQFFLISLLMFFSGQAALAWTIELTEDELQAKINKRVPIEKKKLVFTIKVSTIDVMLNEGSDRIGLLANMEIRSPHLASGKGQAQLDGKLEYDQQNGQFYLREPEVRQVQFENIPDKYHGLLKKLFQGAIRKRLSHTPIYKLDQNKTRHQLTKALLKSVQVKNGKLVLEMGLF